MINKKNRSNLLHSLRNSALNQGWTKYGLRTQFLRQVRDKDEANLFCCQSQIFNI